MRGRLVRALVMAVLGAAVLAVGGCTAVTGVAGSTSDEASENGNETGGTVSVLYAGGLVKAFEEGVGPAFAERTGYSFRGEGRGSVAAANLIRDRLRRPDVFVSADADVNSLLMDGTDSKVEWYVTFGGTEMVLAYSDRGPLADEFAAAARGERSWHEVLRHPDLRLGRSDPDLDPSGYRTLFLFELAEEELGLEGLKERVLGDDSNPSQIFPEEELGARLEVGQLDAAFLYRTVAVPHSLPFVDLPPEIDQGSPKHADLYATVSYENGDTGAVYRGKPVTFTATVLEDAANPEGGAELIRLLLSEEGRRILGEYGVSPTGPEAGGNAGAVPGDLKALLDGGPGEGAR